MAYHELHDGLVLVLLEAQWHNKGSVRMSDSGLSPACG